MNSYFVSFGEVLWDVLPTVSIAGGAPMNVAIRLQSLGMTTKIISSIGNDTAGKALCKILQERNMDLSLIQEDSQLPTGKVLVSLDANGIASYDIVNPSAWDNIVLNAASIEAVKNAKAFLFGSLACRNKQSKETLLSLLEIATYRIFDVNLRPPFYDFQFIDLLLQQANFIKLNDEELQIINKAIGLNNGTIEDQLLFIASKYPADTICVTRGNDGAILYANHTLYSHPGYRVHVADTIGAGDSFLAALITQIFKNGPSELALAYACAMGALVASKSGANPIISRYEIDKIMGD